MTQTHDTTPKKNYVAHAPQTEATPNPSGREPVVIMGGYMSNYTDYSGLKEALEAPPYKLKVYVAKVHRMMWFGKRDWQFQQPMDALRREVNRAREETGSATVKIIGHSAGGRLARIYLGDKVAYKDSPIYNGQAYVSTLIALGSAYWTHEKYSQYTSKLANDNYPGAYYNHVRYVSVMGKAIHGRLGLNLEEVGAYRTYRLQTGNGDEWGDGVVPIKTMPIPGAENIMVRGVYHVPYLGRRFYSDVLSAWDTYLLDN